jgi:crotonobetainyl-CoA:carnitine CoA-transferase CaiB-like acyl-CoA transferase
MGFFMNWRKINVLELSSVLAGPMVGDFFAELGAKVIKIENALTRGDVTRSWRIPGENTPEGTSAYFLSCNHRKKSLFLNLEEKNDIQKVIDLIGKSDVVISNFLPETGKKLKLSVAHIRKYNPQIIIVHISGFENQPDRPAFDLAIQAETGWMHLNRNEKGEPRKLPIAFADLITAHQAIAGTLLALLEKKPGKKGKTVKVALNTSALTALKNLGTNQLNQSKTPKNSRENPTLSHPNIAPYGEVFYTKNKKPFVLAIGNDRQFKALCKLLDLAHLQSDSRFTTNSLRVKNRKELEKILLRTLRKWNETELTRKLKAAKIPFGMVRTPDAVFKRKEFPDRILLTTKSGKRIKNRAFKL